MWGIRIVSSMTITGKGKPFTVGATSSVATSGVVSSGMGCGVVIESSLQIVGWR
jgi:hypothetical protein